MTIVLSSILLLILSGAIATWAYSSSWGYYPERGLAVVAIAVLVLWAAAYL